MPRLEQFKGVVDRLSRTRRAYHAVFGTPEGQLVLHDLLRRCGMLETSQVNGDPHMVAFREGRRSVGLDLVHAMRWTEAEVIQLALARTGEQLSAAHQED